MNVLSLFECFKIQTNVFFFSTATLAMVIGSSALDDDINYLFILRLRVERSLGEVEGVSKFRHTWSTCPDR